MVQRTFPISRLDPLYSTRVLLDLNQDCGSSYLQPLDSRRDSLHHSVQLNLVHEVYWMPTLDTFFHSQSGSKFPCTHVRVESVYILHKVNIHKVKIQEHLDSADLRQGESGPDPQSVSWKWPRNVGNVEESLKKILHSDQKANAYENLISSSLSRFVVKFIVTKVRSVVVFPQNWPTLQRGLSTIAELLVT